jgi:hypothetical protein
MKIVTGEFTLVDVVFSASSCLFVTVIEWVLALLSALFFLKQTLARCPGFLQ